VVMVCWGAICSRGHFSGLQVRVPLELLSQGLQKTVVSDCAGRQQTQAHKSEKSDMNVGWWFQGNCDMR
jgi:hypothetical protein